MGSDLNSMKTVGWVEFRMLYNVCSDSCCICSLLQNLFFLMCPVAPCVPNGSYSGPTWDLDSSWGQPDSKEKGSGFSFHYFPTVENYGKNLKQSLDMALVLSLILLSHTCIQGLGTQRGGCYSLVLEQSVVQISPKRIVHEP